MRVTPCGKLLDLHPVHGSYPRLPAAYQTVSSVSWPVLSVKRWLPSRADG